jgi:hypothetical protein
MLAVRCSAPAYSADVMVMPSGPGGVGDDAQLAIVETIRPRQVVEKIHRAEVADRDLNAGMRRGGNHCGVAPKKSAQIA